MKHLSYERLLSILLTFAILFSLAACGGKDLQPEPEKPVPEQTQKEPSAEKPPEMAPEDPPEPSPEEDPTPAVTPLRLMKGADHTSEYDDNYTQLFAADWEHISLISDCPELAAALEELNIEQAVGAHSFVQEWLPDAREFLEYSPDYYGCFSYESEYTVQRADTLILSLREDYSSYTGGVHGNYGVMGWNYDTASGVRLELADVLTETDGLDEILAEKIRAKYAFEPFPSLDETLAGYAPEDYTWTLGYQGITFYFSPYEIASYAAGLLTATVWFDEMPELFREEYTLAPEGGYAVALPNWYDFDIDLDPGDGVRDTLSVWTQESEFGTVQLCIYMNGPEFVDESWYAYSITPYLVCLGEEFFLMVEGSSENDYRTLYIYRLKDGAATLTAELSGVGFMGHWLADAGQDGIYCTEVFNTPWEFTLGSKCDLLGTKTACRSYSFAPGGALIPLTDVYELSKDLPPITSTVPLEVTLLPENTAETVPVGTEFFFLQTDNDTYVDLAMADGRECRIVIERIDWTPTINGIPEWECFEDLMYAG